MDWIQDLLEADPTQPSATASAETGLAEQAALATVRRVIRLRQEVESFQSRWPTPTGEAPLAPSFTWDQLERQLADLAGDPVKALMARDLVSATRKMAAFKPPEMVLREILCLSWALLDEGFRPQAGPDWAQV